MLQQVMPAFEHAAQVLHDSQASAADRAQVAAQIEQMAAQAAEGEADGSPWLDAAVALRALAHLLRGGVPNMATLTPTYRTLLERIRGG